MYNLYMLLGLLRTLNLSPQVDFVDLLSLDLLLNIPLCWLRSFNLSTEVGLVDFVNLKHVYAV